MLPTYHLLLSVCPHTKLLLIFCFHSYCSHSGPPSLHLLYLQLLIAFSICLSERWWHYGNLILQLSALHLSSVPILYLLIRKRKTSTRNTQNEILLALKPRTLCCQQSPWQPFSRILTCTVLLILCHFSIASSRRHLIICGHHRDPHHQHSFLHYFQVYC